MGFYLCNFLSGAEHFRVRCRSIYSDLQDLENGLPQGSCLSPLLFNIFIDNLFDDVPQPIHYSLYADDAALWCTDADCARSVSRLQASISKLCRELVPDERTTVLYREVYSHGIQSPNNR